MSKVIFRCDDAGSTEGSVDAIRQCVENGVARNISLMAPTSAIEYAADTLTQFADRVNYGLHVTLTSEWDTVRWGSVLPASEVSSLVRSDGTFPASGQELAERVSPDEAEAEIRAQLLRLRRLGFRIDYLDEHMGVGWIPGLRERFHRIAEEEGLVLAESFAYADGVNTQDLASVMNYVTSREDQSAILVFHPLSDLDRVGRQFTLEGRQPGEILRERAQERRVLTDPRLVDLRDSGHFQSLTFREAAGK